MMGPLTLSRSPAPSAESSESSTEIQCWQVLNGACLPHPVFQQTWNPRLHRCPGLAYLHPPVLKPKQIGLFLGSRPEQPSGIEGTPFPLSLPLSFPPPLGLGGVTYGAALLVAGAVPAV
jgi:hypothetical protein